MYWYRNLKRFFANMKKIFTQENNFLSVIKFSNWIHLLKTFYFRKPTVFHKASNILHLCFWNCEVYWSNPISSMRMSVLVIQFLYQLEFGQNNRNTSGITRRKELYFKYWRFTNPLGELGKQETERWLWVFNKSVSRNHKNQWW